MTRRELLLMTGVSLLLGVMPFLPVLGPGTMLFGTDTLAGGFAFYDAFAQQLRHAEFPRWMPMVWGGVPTFANAGSTFQPVHLLATTVLPTALALIVVLVTHFTLAGLGFYVFARALNVRHVAALFAGVAFECTGLTHAWVYAGHDGRIIAVTLSPWVLFFIVRIAHEGRWRHVGGLGAALGCVLLGNQLQLAWYLLVLSAGLGSFELWSSSAPGRWRRARRAVFGVTLGFGLAAINLLPFAGYVSQSARGGEGPAWSFSTSFAAAPRDLAGFAMPDVPGLSITRPGTQERPFADYEGANRFKLHTEYVGAAVVLLALLSVLNWRARRVRFFAGATVFFTVLGLGANTPLYLPLTKVLPGLHRFRAADLAWSMVVVLLVALAALALETWLERTRLRALWLAGAVIAVGSTVVAFTSQRPEALPRFLVPLVFTLLALALLHRVQRWAWLALVLISAGDLLLVARHFVFAVPPPAQTLPSDDLIAFLRARPKQERVWVLPAPKPWRSGGNLLAMYGVPQLGGEHPLPSKRLLSLVGMGVQTAADWHELVRDPTWTDAGLSFETRESWLSAANVRHVVSTVPLDVPGWTEVFRSGSGLVYERADSQPAAWLNGRVRVVPDAAASLAAMREPGWHPRNEAIVEVPGELWFDEPLVTGAAIVTAKAPSRMTVQVLSDRRALLVVSETWHDGWRAFVDGVPAPVFLTNHAFRGVPVPAGQHLVELRFEPPALWSGVLLSLVSLALCLALLVRRS